MSDKLKLAWQLWRFQGPSWLFYRLRYAFQMRIGLLQRRMPTFEWHERPLISWLKADIPGNPAAYRRWRQQFGGRFFFDVLPDLSSYTSWDIQQVLEEANDILVGRWRYFEHTVYDVGFPPDWHLNPMTGQQIPANLHWTQISDFGHGDIKLVWEASRFGAVYMLVRAYAISKDERYPAAFWALIEDWAAKNPPNLGPNWKSGQEMAIRIMAWCFGLYGFADSHHSTPERIMFLSMAIAAQAERITCDISFAVSTKSNHGISEAVGLFTVGLLFPEFERAKTWMYTGRQLLEKEIRRQIYTDGAYVMPSTNYFRMSLHACLWAMRLGELNNQQFSDDFYNSFSKGLNFLCQLLDPVTGQLPNFGSNDGALILPLDTCDYIDYRPLLQSCYYAMYQQHLFEEGPWNEDLFWLFGPESLSAPLANKQSISIDDLASTVGGYYTLRSKHSWAMIRCAELIDRPSQIDQLHVDLWWQGINIACDAGTYLYNGPAPWRNGLVSTGVHNTVQVDGQEQMTQVGHFTWVDWANGRVRHHLKSDDELLAYWEGEHTGYQVSTTGALHRRGVLRFGIEHWLVIDRLESQSDHTYRLHWLMPEFPHQWNAGQGILELATPEGSYQAQVWSDVVEADYSLIVGDEHSTQGWRSQYYGHKHLALSLIARTTGSTLQFFTVFGPDITIDTKNRREIQLTTPRWIANVQFQASIVSEQLVRTITITGEIQDSLEIIS